MDLRNINQHPAEGKRELAVKKSTANRPNTAATVPHKKCSTSGLPDGSKSLSKIHPLGTIPKYLRKQKQTSAASTSSSSVQETIITQSDKVDGPGEPLVPIKPVSDEQLDAEYKQQTIDRLERHVQELLSELGYREHRIKELELRLCSTRQTLAQMQSMMQSHLKEQQPSMKRIPTENKILLLLRMILDSQTNSRQAAGEQQDHEDRST